MQSSLTGDLDRVATLLQQHAAAFGIDPRSLWRPSVHAVAAWRTDGSLLRVDLTCWTAQELTR